MHKKFSGLRPAEMTEANARLSYIKHTLDKWRIEVGNCFARTYDGANVITGRAVQCSAVQCSAVQCSAVQCSTVQYSAVQCSAVQCSAVQCSAVQCSAVQCSAVQCSAVQCSTVQCSAVLAQKMSLQLLCSLLCVNHGLNLVSDDVCKSLKPAKNSLVVVLKRLYLFTSGAVTHAVCVTVQEKLCIRKIKFK
jgi:hypothetical protein